MSTAKTTFSDEELTAYLDGALDAKTHAQIDAALEADAELVQRLAALDIPLDQMRAAMSAEMLAAPRLPAALVEPAAPQRRYWVPAAIAASFAVGFAVNTLMQPKETSGWTTAVASYQALYVAETLAGPVQQESRKEDVLNWASSVFDVDLTPATKVDGITFKRAQMLGFKGKPLLQIAYLGRNGTPMALCLTTVDGPDKGPEQSVLFDLAGVSWVQDGVGYYLVGGEDLDEVSTLTTQIRAVL